MNIKKAYFLKSCTSAKQFPSYPYPEFAFFGRSNVGKSSLLNMILGVKGLVKTGSRPGVTQTINFFVVNDNLSFVDLPGLGYAKLPGQIKNKFIPMINEYIESRENLKIAFLLIDCRRTPGDYEHELIEKLTEKKRNIAIILTKCDKLSGNELSTSIKRISEELSVDKDAIFPTSAKSGRGKKELISLIDEFSKR